MTSQAPRAAGTRGDTVATTVSDDVDLEALMLRVRDAAMIGIAGAGTAPPHSGEAGARELDLVRVLQAQDEWNEQARQSLMALVDGLRALRDDWTDVQAALRREIVRLTAMVEQLRTASVPKPTRASRKPRPAGKRRPRR